jgi:hypothetical protein
MGSSRHNWVSMHFHISLIFLPQFRPIVRVTTMNFPTPEAVFSYLAWRATEEDYDAEFLEECARRFEEHSVPFLHNAEIYRKRAQNIRANLAVLRGDGLA